MLSLPRLSAGPSSVGGMMSVREHMSLDIEARHWPRRAIGRKDAAIFELTGMTPVKHAQVVLGLIERGDVVAEYPVLVHRLRRLRDERARARGTAYPVGP